MPDMTGCYPYRDPYMDTYEKLRKKRKKNSLPPKFKITTDKKHCWIAFCEYGRVSITSEKNLLRITTSKKGGKNTKFITCKYDKYNNFRVYLKDSKGVRDVAYMYPYEYPTYIKKRLNSITNVRGNKKAVDRILDEYETRFLITFNNGYMPSDRDGNPISNKIWKLIYPLNEEKGDVIRLLPAPSSKKVKGKAPFFIRRAIRSHDPKELTRKIFGRAPKSLTKAVIAHLPLNEKSINILFLAKVFYGIWPLDKVVEFLNHDPKAEMKNFIFESNEYHYMPSRRRLNTITHINQWRKFFRQFSYNKVLNWYKNYTRDFGHYTLDTLHPLKDLEKRGFKVSISRKMDIKDIHDSVARHYDRVKRPEVALPVYDALYELNGQKIDNYDIVFPKTNYDLIDWGKYMNICVGSYGGRVANGGTVVFSLQDNGSPIYCIELIYQQGYNSSEGKSLFRLVQCKLNRNQRATVEFKEKVQNKVDSVFNSDIVNKPELMFPKGHVVKDITKDIDLEALDNIQPAPVVEPVPELNPNEDIWGR